MDLKTSASVNILNVKGKTLNNDCLHKNTRNLLNLRIKKDWKQRVEKDNDADTNVKQGIF